jgi:hypothetical protein
MLDTLIQLIAAAGPIVLAIMGIVVSLYPPQPQGRAHFVWAGAFVIIGLITGCCLFTELRGTDAVLDKIWNKLSSEEDSSFIDVLNVVPVKVPNNSLNFFNIAVSNIGNKPATRVSFSASGFISKSNLSQQEIKHYIDNALSDTENLEKINKDIDNINIGHGAIYTLVDAKSQLMHSNVLYVTDDVLAEISGGTAALYTFLSVRYEDAAAKDNSYRQFLFCGYFTLSYSYWHTCFSNRTTVDGKRF